jgi:glycosyltransferase involved in cell wall biosynthesis
MKRDEPKLLSVVMPAHNEAAGIANSLDVLSNTLDSCGMEWEIIVIDDGSSDETFHELRELAQSVSHIKGIQLSRNFGKEAALLAGLRAANGCVVVTIDADLQHPPQLIPQMIDAWQNGAKVVDAVKSSRENDGAFARVRARFFNAMLSKLGGINLQNASDYKLLDRTIVDTIARDLPESQRFYRGLSDWVGYDHVTIPFDVEERVEGDSKWTLWKLIELATTAIVSFTSAPLRIVTILGMATLLFGFIVALEALIGWFRGEAVSGFTTIIITLLLLGSFIMISLGIIGEYIAKIYDESKQRPSYLIESSIGIDQDDDS